MANTVEIILSANDQVSSVVAGVVNSVSAIGVAVSSRVLPAVLKLGTVAFSVFGGVKTGIEGILKTVDELDAILLRFTGTTLGQLGKALQDNLIASISDASQASLSEVFDALGGIASRFTGLNGISLSIDASPLSDSMKRAAEETAASFRQTTTFLVNSFDVAFQKITGIAQSASQELSSIIGGVGDLSLAFSGTDEVVGLFRDFATVISPVTDTLSQIGFQIANIQSVIGALQPIVASGPFRLLIQQNIELRDQLLATQSTLAGTSKVFQNGLQVTDPTASINALRQPVEEAFNRVREGSLELAGVTSRELVDTFNVVAGQAGNIGANLNQAADLTLNFAAAMSTLNVPLFQSSQEISSIVNAQIDQNSILARALNISNEQVRTYQTQGKLIEFLNSRLSSFRAGNAILAQGFTGITSNITEAIENIGRIAGQDLLDPILRQLQSVLDYLNKNQDGIAKFVAEIGEQTIGAVEELVKSIGALLGQTDELAGNSIQVIFNGITGAIEALTGAIQFAATAFAPFINALTAVSGLVPTFLNPMIMLAIQAKVLGAGIGLLTGGFGRFAKGLPFVGEMLLLMNQRSSSLIGLLTGLTKASSIGAAGFLTLGANLATIPGAMGMVANKIPVFGTQLAALIPAISQIGIAGVAASKQLGGFVQSVPALASTVGLLGSSFSTFLQGSGSGGGLPEAIEKIKEFVRSNESLKFLVPVVDEYGSKLQSVAVNANFAEIANRKFEQSIIGIRNMLISMAVKFAAVSIAVYAVFRAFDELVLKNQELLSTLSAIGQGLGSFAKMIADGITSPMGLATIAIGGATAALVLFGNVIKLQIAGAALPVFVKGVSNVVGSLTLLSTVARAFGAIQFAAVFTSTATSVSVLATAAASGTLSVGALSVAFGKLAITAGLVLAPIAAIAAGIATIGIARYTKDLEESTEATQILIRASGVVADDALRFGNNLKGVRDEQKKNLEQGLELTKADIERNKVLAEQAKLQLQGLDAEIARLEAQKKDAVGSENKAAIDAQIASLNAVKTAITGYANEVELAGDPVFRLSNRLAFLQENLKRFGATLDAETKEANANIAEGLLAGVMSTSEAEEKKVQITQAGYQRQLAETEKGLKELQDRYAKLSPEEVEKAREVQDGITALRGEAADLRTKIAEGEVEEQVKAIERASTRALRVTKEAESKRQIAIQQLRNDGQFSDADAQELLAKSNQQRIQEEIDAERNKLASLLSNEKANADQIRESRERLLGLTLESLKAEEEAYDAYIARVGDALEAQATERETVIQDAVNAGVQTEAQANQERAKISVARLQGELQAETRNVERRRQLLLQLSQAERQLQDANLAVLQEALNRQTQAFQNAITAQNNELQKQVALYNVLNDALSTRVNILEAQKNVESAAEGFLTSQINAVASLETSDRRRKELAKATAIIQFDALLRRQELEDKILATQQEQNRLALQRQKIENDIAQSDQRAEIAASDAEIASGETELAQGKISQDEFDARVRRNEALRDGLLARQQARSIIDEQIAIQPTLDRAVQQTNELNQGRERTEGIVGIFNTLSRREQRRVRGQLQDFFAQSAGFDGRRDLLNESRGLVGQFTQNVRQGNPMAGSDIFEELTPVTSAISAALDRAQANLPTEQSLAGQQVDLGTALTNQLESIKSTVFQVQLANAQDLPQLSLPDQFDSLAMLNDVKLPDSLAPIQGGATPITPQMAQQIADAFWERFSGFGDGVTRGERGAEPPRGVKVDAINTTINLQDTGEVAKKIASQTQQQLLETVQRANQLARTSR